MVSYTASEVSAQIIFVLAQLRQQLGSLLARHAGRALRREVEDLRDWFRLKQGKEPINPNEVARAEARTEYQQGKREGKSITEKPGEPEKPAEKRPAFKNQGWQLFVTY
ncbi:Hypothetical protein D9617_7g029240 [Elsinoe fawcettii]|nr:Hypothetical protein D9617_7g029240 [Elsinoe fawcettii]